MSTTLEPPKSPEIDAHAFEHHWQDEADAAYLYRLLSAAEPDPKKKDVYSRLADVEDRHVVVWSNLLTAHGHPPPKFRPSGRAKLLATLGRWFGPSFLLPMLLEEEGREVKAYLDMHRETPRGAPGGPEALILARESAEHATTLGAIAGKGGEPWHKTSSGGFLRNVVYGFNDGLTANFGLVAGVIGAATVNQHQAVVVAGVAGLIADALSMGSSGYLASKSEREVYEYEISMEKTEVELMPEIERDELAIIYETKGMDRDSAHSLATRVMADPQLMLKEQVQEELKIGEFNMSPLREGWITGLATAFGAAIPVFPFLIWRGTTAIVIAFTV
ncbi:MAG TPA: VIT1/CCC1 transporter family protein, partial [Gemmatimonadaceae bacterium]|nr:VIT1/CCC1 transporter family protein [Gemmatimonadaceae bacterium]